MKGLQDNDFTLLCVYDEFSTLVDSLDKGSNGNCDKGRYLTLCSAVTWSKKTKTNGTMTLKDPRHSIISYKQPFYAINFARNNLQDGFFQRFLITVPQEVFVMLKEKENAVKADGASSIILSDILRNIYNICCEEVINMTLSEAAKELYTKLHDDVQTFRRDNPYGESRVSI
eukprot:TCONS_00040078-protein